MGKYKFILAFETFNEFSRRTCRVYKTGLRYWKADDSYNYAIVIGLFRIIFSINRKMMSCSN